MFFCKTFAELRLTKCARVCCRIEAKVLHIFSLELLVLGDEHLVLRLVHLVTFLASCDLHHFSIVTLEFVPKEKKYLQQIIVNFPRQISVDSVICFFVFELLFYVPSNPLLDISINPDTSCIAVESLGRVLLNTVSTLGITNDHVLDEKID